MITVTKINDRDMVINCDLILSIERTPDTTITTTTGAKIIVLNSVDDIIEKVVAFKQRASIKVSE